MEKQINYNAEDYRMIESTVLAVERNELAHQIGNYLYDVLMHRLSEKQILRGYMLYWVKYDKGIHDLMSELHFRCEYPSYKPDEIKTIIAGIQMAMRNYLDDLKENNA